MNSSSAPSSSELVGEDSEEASGATYSDQIAVLHRYATFVCSLIMCVCCVVGVFGNSISLVIFTRRCMRSPINVLLTGLSLVDLFVVVFAIPVFVTPGVGVFYFHSGKVDLAEDAERTAAYNRFVDRLYTMIVFGMYQMNMIAQTSSVWTCVVICSERYLAVCKPFVAQRYSTVNRAKAVQISVFVAAIGYNFVRFFEYEPDEASGGFKRRLRDDTWYIYIYYTALYLITHFIVPFIFITATNVLILRTLRRAHYIRNSMTGNKSDQHQASRRSSAGVMGSPASLIGRGLSSTSLRQNEKDRRSSAVQNHQTSHVIVVVTIMFTLCNTLSFVISIWEAFQLDLFVGRAAVAAFLLLDLSNVLVVFNSATTFLFYLRYCTKYRTLFLFYCANVASRHPCCRKFMSAHWSEVPKGASVKTYRNTRSDHSTRATSMSRRSTRVETDLLTRSSDRPAKIATRTISCDEPHNARSPRSGTRGISCDSPLGRAPRPSSRTPSCDDPHYGKLLSS